MKRRGKESKMIPEMNSQRDTRESKNKHTHQRRKKESKDSKGNKLKPYWRRRDPVPETHSREGIVISTGNVVVKLVISYAHEEFNSYI